MSRHPFKVLIIDDEKNITELLSNYLSFEGFSVDTSNAPLDALKLASNTFYHLIISDISMPDLSGIELARKIKQQHSLTQFVFITGYVTMENILTAFELGASNIFFKPFDDLNLIKAEVETSYRKIQRILEILTELKSKKGA